MSLLSRFLSHSTLVSSSWLVLFSYVRARCWISVVRVVRGGAGLWRSVAVEVFLRPQKSTNNPHAHGHLFVSVGPPILMLHTQPSCIVAKRAVMLAIVPGAHRVIVRQVRRKTLGGSYKHHPGAGAFVGASTIGTRVPPHLDGECPTTGIIVRRLALRPRYSR